MLSTILVLQAAFAGSVMAQGTPHVSSFNTLPAPSAAMPVSQARSNLYSGTGISASIPSARSEAATTPVQATSSQTAPTPTTSQADQAGPRADMTRAGITTEHAANVPANAQAAAAPQHLGHGQNVALMIVGGAALITGLVIGGDGGTLIAIGGAVVGLYGLFNFVK